MRRFWLVALLLAAALPGQARTQGDAGTRIPDVIYGKKHGVALTMDVFKPEKPNGIGVLWMVSGGWVSNHNNINAGLAAPFIKRGMTVFQIVHGSQPKYSLPEITQDIYRAVRFVRANAATWGVDPNRLGISGGSAGGHLSLMVGAFGAPGDATARDPIDRASSEVQAVACFFPPTDFLNYGTDGQNAISNPMLRPFWPAFGVTEATTAGEKEKIGRTYSPYYGLSAKMPPTLIVHGDADMLVPIQQAKRVISKLEELKVPAKLEVRPGKAHGWPEMPKDLELFADWFEKHLPAKQAAR